ncbi:MAG: response regulator transcription factor [Bacteroidales bacterium]
MRRVLVVDDEPHIRAVLRGYLEADGFAISEGADGESAVRAVRDEHPDLVLLDVMLPGIDGLEALRQVRAFSDVYVVLVTARAEEVDKLVGLGVGADDYVTKPFSPRELRARIQAMLRRTGDGAAGVERFSDVEVDFDRAEVRRAGTPIDVTALELRLLKTFLARRGRALTRAQLIDLAWDPGTNVSDRVVDTHVLNLRKKIEPIPEEPRFIRGVRGIGYRFDG